MTDDRYVEPGPGDMPMVQALRDARHADRHPTQIPGHKNRYRLHRETIGYGLMHELVRDDMALQGGVDDNAFTGKVLVRTEAMYEQAIGADHTRFLVGGSSQGNMTTLLALANDGDPIALDRTSHRSVLAGLVLSGARPVWLQPTIHPEFGIPVGMPASAVESIAEDVVGLVVTSPAYVGTMSDVAAIARQAHARGIPLSVDQAWGAHLDFIPPGMLDDRYHGGIARGADLAVTSVHKSLMGFSQAAVVSCRGRLVDEHRLDRAVDTLSTTSHSAVILASIDATRALVSANPWRIEQVASDTADARALLARVPGLVVIDEDVVDCAVDPWKITLWLPRTGVTGVALADLLWAEGNGVESADDDTLVMTMTYVDEREWILETARKLAGMIESLRAEPRTPMPSSTWHIVPEVVLPPRQAIFGSRERIPLASAAGRISVEQFCPYPPGVPLLGPGELVTEEIIAAIGIAGTRGRVAYCSDPSLETIEVVA